MSVWLSRVHARQRTRVDAIEVGCWQGGMIRLDVAGTVFVVACEPAVLRTRHGRYPLPPGGYAVAAEVVDLEGGAGVYVTCPGHRGLFLVGGPVETVGRLRYIDGCSDTLLVAPIVRGDPCLNYLHLPVGVVQTDHVHPSLRAGIVLRGDGRCVIDGDVVHELGAGTVFVLEAGTTHHFECVGTPLEIVAWHPDSDSGPTDDDHPMLNRTLLPGTVHRVR